MHTLVWLSQLSRCVSGVLSTRTTPIQSLSSSQGYDIEWCRSPDRGLPAPDTVLYLQLSIEDAMKRGGFGQERYEKVEAQTVVKQIYEEKLRDETWQVSDRQMQSLLGR